MRVVQFKTIAGFAIAVLLIISSSQSIFAQFVTATSGDWNLGTTWVDGIVPGEGANVTINHSVTLSDNRTLGVVTIYNTVPGVNAALQIQSGAQVVFSSLTVSNDINNSSSEVIFTITNASLTVNGSVFFQKSTENISQGTSFVLTNSAEMVVYGDLMFRQAEGIATAVDPRIEFLVESLSNLTVTGKLEFDQQSSTALETFDLRLDQANLNVGGNLIVREETASTTQLLFTNGANVDLFGSLLRLERSGEQPSTKGSIIFQNSSNISFIGAIQFVDGNDLLATPTDSVIFDQVILNMTSFNGVLLPTVDQVMVVKGTLFLSNGVIVTGQETNRQLQLDINATMVQSNTESVVRGPVRKKGTQDMTFYLSGFNPSFTNLEVLNMTGANQSTVYEVNYTDEEVLPLNPSMLPGITRFSKREAWKFNVNAGPSPSDMQLAVTLLDTDFSQISSIVNDLTLVGYILDGDAYLENLGISNITGDLPGPVRLLSGFFGLSPAILVELTLASTSETENLLGNRQINGLNTTQGTTGDIFQISGQNLNATNTQVRVNGVGVPVQTSNENEVQFSITNSVNYGPVTLLDNDYQMQLPNLNFQFYSDSLVDNRTFNNKVPQQANTNFTKIRTGDANNDGLQDVFILSPAESEIKISLGNGNGGAQSNSSYPIPANAIDFAVADLNNDGWLDYVVLIENSFTAQIYVNNGDGTFDFLNPFPVDFESNGPQVEFKFIRAADITGDGYNELIAASVEPGFETRIQYVGLTEQGGAGSLSFITQIIVDLKMAPIRGNGDFRSQFLASFQDGTFKYGNFGEEPLIVFVNSGILHLLDYNNDSFIDVLIETQSGFLELLQNNNGISFTQNSAIPYSLGAVAIDNFNGDEWVDITYIDTNGDLYIGRNQAGTEFIFEQANTNLLSDNTIKSITPIAYNGNEGPDLLIVDGTGLHFVANEILPPAPEATVSFSVTNYSDSVEISWMNTLPGDGGFLLVRYEDNGEQIIESPQSRTIYEPGQALGSGIVLVFADTNRYLDTLVLAGKNYIYELYTVATRGNVIRVSATPNVINVSVPIPNIEGFSIDNLTAISANVSWDPIASATEYQVTVAYDDSYSDINLNYDGVLTADPQISLINLRYSSSVYLLVRPVVDGTPGSESFYEFKLPISERLHADSTQLLSIYNNYDGASWNNSSGWLTDRLDQWYGITLKGDSVTGVFLETQNIDGVFPEALGAIEGLQSIALSFNAFNGLVSDTLRNLKHLESLTMANNNFEGVFPDVFSEMPNFSFLDITANAFAQSLPASLASNTALTELYAGNNQLSGLPTFLPSLNVLFVFNNKLQFADIEANIGVIDFDYSNQSVQVLTAAIPVFENQALLLDADISGANNSYQWYKNGEPITDSTNATLVFSAISIADVAEYYCVVANSLATDINITSTTYTLLLQNSVTDSLALLELYASLDGPNWTNTWNLSEPMATWHGVVLENGYVVDLNLDFNNLTGSLPVAIGDLVKLRNLYLSGNAIIGSLPAELGAITSLEYLGLYSNNLEGEVPATLATLPNLLYLYLSDNYFTELPDFSTASSLIEIQVFDNRLAFDDFERNLSVLNVFGNLGQRDIPLADTLVQEGTNFVLFVPVAGSANEYQWNRIGVPINEQTTNALDLPNISLFDAGSYQLEITNPLVDGLILRTTFFQLDVFGTGSRDTDSLALVALYNSTNGPFWNNNTGWLTEPLEDWHGIIINSNRVRGIDLRQNNLLGTLPNQLGVLVQLSFLNLTTNQISGELPTSIYNLSNLSALDLAGNMLSGEMSESIGNLSGLSYLALSTNNFTGSIPNSIGSLSNLTILSLNRNNFSGPLPTAIGDLTNLNFLSLFNNQLSGELPASIGNLVGLTSIDVGDNQFTGSIPASFGNLSSLTNLALYKNQLTGILPNELDSLSSLTTLFLSENNFEGSINLSLLNLPNLTNVSLSINNFSSLPDLNLLDNPNKFSTLNLTNNRLTFESIEPNFGLAGFTYVPQKNIVIDDLIELISGEDLNITVNVGGANNQYQWFKNGSPITEFNSDLVIPVVSMSVAGIYRLQISNSIVDNLILNTNPVTVTVASAISISDSLALIEFYNALNGPNWTNNTGWLSAPLNEWAGVTLEGGRVVSLELNSNNLIGVLPAELGEISALRLLSLSDNQLSGDIPASLSQTSLEHLSLSNNQFIGALPLEVFGITNLVYLDLSVNEFSGAIPDELGQLTNLIQLVLATNQLSGSLPSSIGNLQNLEVLNLNQNQLSAVIPESLGSLANLIQLDLSRNQFTGGIPNDFDNLINLQVLMVNENNLEGGINLNFLNREFLRYIDISFNSFSSLPDVSLLDNPSKIEFFNVAHNRLSFESIVPAIIIPNFNYAPQQPIGTDVSFIEQTGAEFEIAYTIGGVGNQYQWFKNNQALAGATNTTLLINELSFANEGQYQLQATNLAAPDLVLNTAITNLRVSSLQRDSLALRVIYFNTNGAQWTNAWNMNANISTWTGVTVSNDRVSGLNLQSRNIQGEIPIDILDIQNLSNLNLSNNGIAALPDLTSLSLLTQLNVSNNRLDFGDILPNINIPGFNFANQALIGQDFYDVQHAGTTYTLNFAIAGLGNTYQWFRNNTAITGATSAAFTINNLNFNTMGDYRCEVRNPATTALIPDFRLQSAISTILAKATIFGSVVDANNNPVNAGRMYMFEQNVGAKYDTVFFAGSKFVNFQNNGSFTLPDVILGNYLIFGDPNSTQYPNLLPTYYTATIDWQQADAFLLRADSANVKLTLQGTPAALNGQARLTGYLEEENSGARLLTRTRVEGGGVTLSRTSTQNRDLNDDGVLVAYVRTDANGNFIIPKLEAGTYVLKVNYPGVPMDESTDTRFTLRGFSGETIEVAATVIDGVIKVETLRYTGINQPTIQHLIAYPNPARDQVSIMVGSQSPAKLQVTIFDMQGQRVLEQKINVENNQLRLDVNHLKRGIYTIKIIGDTLVGQSRLVLE